MKDVKGRIEKIKELYDELKFEDDIEKLKEDEKAIVYHKNQTLSEEIVELIDNELDDDQSSIDALFWKIKIHNGPYYEDTSVILSTAEEIIERFKDDTKGVLKAYDWLAWGYENKLDLKDKAIEVLHDKLIEISLIKDDYSLQDREFGETYYLIALLYKDMDDLDTAGAFYKLANEHFPDHYYASFQGGMLFLDRKEFDVAFPMLDSFYIFHANEYSSAIGKKIEEYYNDGTLGNRWDYLYLMYCIGLDFPTEMGAKSSKEFGMKYLKLIDDTLAEDPNHTFALRMKARHYMDVDRNTKKAFEMLSRYYDITKVIVGTLYFELYELGKKQNIDVHAKNYTVDTDGFHGYNLMTRFLEKAGELKSEGEIVDALVYYKIAQEIGLITYPIMKSYLKEGIGSKTNNNAHGFAMLCNNLGIAIRNVETLEESDFSSANCQLALELHKEGYEYSPFWENLDSGMRMAEAMKDFDRVVSYGTDLLEYSEEYSASWMIIKGRLIKNLIQADKYDEVEKFYFDLRFAFESKNIENEEVVSEMICVAAEFFTYTRYQKSEFEKTIKLTEDFFSNPIYFDLNDEVAYVNYWFSLAWCNHGLNKRDLAQKYFDLLIEKYTGSEQYQSTVDEIPREYTMDENEKIPFDKFRALLTMDSPEVKDFPLSVPSDINVQNISKLESYLGNLPGSTVDITLDDNVLYKVVGRHATNTGEDDRYDTLLDIYNPREHVTIRYNLIDSKKEKSFFSFLNKNAREKQVYVFFYHYTEDNNESNGYVDFEDEQEYYKDMAQLHWNKIMSNLRSLL